MAHSSIREETTVAELRAELSQCTIQSTNQPEHLQETDLSTVDCVVYEHKDTVADLSQFLAEIRSDGPLVPFLLVVRSDSDVAIGSFLATEQTDVIQISDQSDGVLLLAHRIKMLLEMDRQRSQLSRAENRYDTLFERLTHSAVETRFDGETPIISQVNRAFEETFGYDETEIIGESLDAYIVPPDRREEAREINRRALNGEVLSREVTRQTATGTQEFLLTTGAYDEPERFAIYTDISEQKRQKRELERKNERLDRFAKVVSHDLQKPLHVAQGELGLARAELENEHLDAVADAHDRMGELLNDLLMVARYGDAAQEMEPIELAAIAESAWHTVETAAATLVIETEQTIRADWSHIQQLLENLFRNSVEHGSTGNQTGSDDSAEHGPTGNRTESGDAIEHAGEDVTVTVGDTEGGFYVADDGPGIPVEKRDEVFEAGYSTAESTGFGLKIVQDIVHAHGWMMDITDSEAGGVKVKITGVEVTSSPS